MDNLTFSGKKIHSTSEKGKIIINMENQGINITDITKCLRCF